MTRARSFFVVTAGFLAISGCAPVEAPKVEPTQHSVTFVVGVLPDGELVPDPCTAAMFDGYTVVIKPGITAQHARANELELLVEEWSDGVVSDISSGGDTRQVSVNEFAGLILHGDWIDIGVESPAACLPVEWVHERPTDADIRFYSTEEFN